jgi:hypothetical protein
MRNIARGLVHFLKQDEGVSAAECALMLALVIVICIVVINPAAPKQSAGDPAAIEISRSN